jgi:tellurite methyltransferase
MEIPRDHPHDDRPADFLVENLSLLPRGKVLDLACGSGRNAVFLAQRGFSVEGVDVSSESIERSLQLAREAGVQISLRAVDLEKINIINSDSYDVIICFNYLQRSLFPHIRQGTKRGGMVVYETYILEQAQFGRPRNPDFLLRPNELLDEFRSFRCLRYREGILENRKAIASIVAEKY